MNLTEKELKNANKFSIFFMLSSKNEILKYYTKFLSQKYKVEKKDDYLIINNNVLRPIYSSETISDKDILESFLKIKNTNYNKLIITCKNSDLSANKIANVIRDKKIIIQKEFDAYQNIYKPLNFIVPNYEEPPKKTKRFNEYLSVIFNKKRTKGYIFAAISLFVASFILRYNIYYIIAASILSILALYSHFNTKYNKFEKPYSFN